MKQLLKKKDRIPLEEAKTKKKLIDIRTYLLKINYLPIQSKLILQK